MKFCPVVLEICRGQVHGARKERRIRRIRIIIRIIRNGAKTISPPNFVAHLELLQFISDYLPYFEKINIFFNMITKKVSINL
jgi:hypothetical protein